MVCVYRVGRKTLDFMHQGRGAQEEVLGWGQDRGGATGGGGGGRPKGGKSMRLYNQSSET